MYTLLILMNNLFSSSLMIFFQTEMGRDRSSSYSSDDNRRRSKRSRRSRSRSRDRRRRYDRHRRRRYSTSSDSDSSRRGRKEVDRLAERERKRKEDQRKEEEETAKRIEDAVTKRVEEELERRRDEIEAEVGDTDCTLRCRLYGNRSVRLKRRRLGQQAELDAICAPSLRFPWKITLNFSFLKGLRALFIGPLHWEKISALILSLYFLFSRWLQTSFSQN